MVREPEIVATGTSVEPVVTVLGRTRRSLGHPEARRPSSPVSIRGGGNVGQVVVAVASEGNVVAVAT